MNRAVNQSGRLVRHLALAALMFAMASMASRASAAMGPHGSSKAGFSSFVTADLPNLVVGQKFDWKGHQYEITRVHEIVRTQVQRTRKSDIDRDVPYIGWVWAILHLNVDGQRMRVKLDANARWESDQDGWVWSKALVYLGDNDSYDFVTRELK